LQTGCASSFLETSSILHGSDNASVVLLDTLQLCGLQQTLQPNCPSGAISAFQGPTTTPPDNTAVQFSALAGLNWDVNANRVYPGASIGAFGDDFYSVICESFSRVATTRTSCTTGTPVGEVHIRYDCSGSTNTFWVLVYLYNGFDLIPTSATPNDQLWVVNRCGDDCGGGDNKFFQVRVTVVTSSTAK